MKDRFFDTQMEAILREKCPQKFLDFKDTVKLATTILQSRYCADLLEDIKDDLDEDILKNKYELLLKIMTDIATNAVEEQTESNDGHIPECTSTLKSDLGIAKRFYLTEIVNKIRFLKDKQNEDSKN